MHCRVPTRTLALALLAATPSSLAAQSDPTPTSADVAPGYVLQMEGQSSEPWRWRVDGGSDVFGVFGEQKSWAPDGSGEEIVEWELRMLDGPSISGGPRTIEEDWGLLLPALAAPPGGLASGEVVATDLGPIAYDSVRWDLRRGEEDREIEGRPAEHWILEVRSWGVQQPGTESEMAGESTGLADLWFAPDLPFSAVPFAVARGSGFPLGVLDPAAARFALHEALPELAERGLLLRAEITSSQLRHVPGMDGPMTLGPEQTTLSVSDVRTDGSETSDGTEDLRVSDYALVDAERAGAMTASGYLVSMCDGARSMADGSSAEGTIGGTALRGGSVFEGGVDGPLRLVVATPPSGSGPLACIVVMAPAGLEPGELAVTSLDVAALAAGVPPAGHAWVTVAGGDEATRSRSMLVVDEGAVVLQSVGSDRVQGSIALRGWRLSRTAAAENPTTTLDEDVVVELEFTALPGN